MKSAVSPKIKKVYIMSFTREQPDPKAHTDLRLLGWQLLACNKHFEEVNSLEKLTYEPVECSAKTGPENTPALRLKIFKECANRETPTGLFWRDEFFFEREVPGGLEAPDCPKGSLLVYFEPVPFESRASSV